MSELKEILHVNSKKRNFSEYQQKALEFSETETMKENIHPVKDLTTHLVSYNSDSSSEKTTPKKCRQSTEEPVTPNTNIKLLTSLAASLDYVNCSTPKSSKSNQYFSFVDSQTVYDSEMCDFSSLKATRKEKSLAMICSRFLEMYPPHPHPDVKIVVSLDEACLKLGVERRRLYDIVNVFESVDILARNAKNQYLWFGKNNLLKSLYKLKATALKENMLTKLQYVLTSECTPSCKYSCILSEVANFNKNFENRNSSTFVPDDLLQPSPTPELRREKSLGIMSQKFLMLFLVSPSKVISLGVAAKVLNGFSQRNAKGAQVKTQIRRLYDIANVLSSIGLIQKELALVQQGRKPAFKYIGPDLPDSPDIPSEPCNESKTSRNGDEKVTTRPCRSLVRHASFQEICAVAELERQKLHLDETPNSAPPFEKRLLNTAKLSDKINFANLQLNHVSDNKETVTGNVTTFKEEKPKSPHIVFQTSSIKKQPELKIINLPKPVTSINMPFYILNNMHTTSNEAIKSPNAAILAPSFWLINTSDNQVKNKTEEKSTVKQDSSSKTVPLSLEQRDAILQSLNISLSDGQIAAIQLEGASQVATANRPCNVLKIIDKTNSEVKDLKASKSISSPTFKEFSRTDTRSNGSGSSCSTRNNSPSSIPVLESPISIPSGYATPIPSATSEISFPSNTEVNDILYKIENQPDSAIKRADNKLELLINNDFKNSTHDLSNVNSNKSATANQISVTDKHNTHHSANWNPLQKKGTNEKIPSSSDSCSSDSLSLEVSKILSDKNLNDNALKNKPFLIDEKTLLSPIKKPNLSFSQIITPPYFPPEAVFIFNPSQLN